MTDLPTVVDKSGLQPILPATLRAMLLSAVAAENPGYAATLPGSLIEDIASTDVGALVLCDAARVEFVNSLTPYGSNDFLTNQLGQIYGPQVGEVTNTSVFEVFSGTVGFTVGRGFTVSDGTNQFVVRDGGVIQSGGATLPLFCVALTPGSFAVPAGTVTTIVTSVPGDIVLSCTNPQDGLPGNPTGESQGSYRARVLQAGLAASVGMIRFLKTLLGDVPGVQPRLVSVHPTGGDFEIIVGGGDPYAVAGAVFEGCFPLGNLVGSTISITGITNASPGVATTDLNHGLVSGQTGVHIAGVVGMTLTGGPYTVTVIDEKTFSFGVDTSAAGTWTSGGVVTPNSRNVPVSINDYPDTYVIPLVNPPQQSVEVTLLWNTTSTNAVDPTAVAQLGSQAIADYVNSIPVGAPINLFELDSVFQLAVAGLIPTPLLTRLAWTVSINGVGVSPVSGTGIVPGDPESYFLMAPSDATVTQG